ncbi:MAG: nitroreductase [Rhodoferax sp.]|nr:nitroreductase [Rhodoferax sp.]
MTRLVTERQSVRTYLPKPVPDALLAQVLTDARRAPSSSNLQPGSFLSVEGEARKRLSSALTDAWRNDQREDYAYFPQPWPMAMRRRQVAAAQALYGALGIAREDQSARDAQFARNFQFFDAPVALVVTLHRDFGGAGHMDLGMAVYGLMLAAQSHGLATCAIGAIASYPDLVRSSLQLDAHCAIACGLALGYADPGAPANQAETTRCKLDDYFRVIA